MAAVAFSIAARRSLHRADLSVSASGGEFDNGPGFDKSRVVIDLDAGELEVFERARRLHAVVSVSRNLLLTEKIFLGSRLLRVYYGAKRSSTG